MIYLFLALAALGIFAALIDWISDKNDDEQDQIVVAKGSCATCTGEDEKCEQECMMEAAIKDIEYYDDEELDQFKGRASDEYTDEEANLFNEIMYTMRPEEVKGWNRSLILRNINIPDQIKDELLIMLDES